MYDREHIGFLPPSFWGLPNGKGFIVLHLLLHGPGFKPEGTLGCSYENSEKGPCGPEYLGRVMREDLSGVLGEWEEFKPKCEHSGGGVVGRGPERRVGDR